MRSITLKMVLAFLGIALVSIVLIVLLARWNTGTEFSRFVSDRWGAEMVETLANHYRTNNSWEGLEKSLTTFNNPPKPGDDLPRASFFTLVDVNGQIISAGPGYRLGEHVQQFELEQGIPIEVDGEIVGTLVMGRIPFERNPREEEFIQRVNRMLVYSALGASLVALLLGVFLSRTLTRPIRELTEATQAVAGGNLGLQVPLRSKDEMGELAASFNKMSSDLARSTDARKQMTADIAHELRTPLSLIIGHADAVHDGVLPPTRENFEIIREEALRLEHLVDDLRTLSLADAGELSINPQPVSPQKLLDDLQATYQHIASQKNVKIQLDAASDISMLNIDPDRITQVLTNILDNALQHTPEGGQINLSARSVQNGVELSIQDNGPGIEGEDVNRIFERFYRTDTARHRDNGGSGLGLAIAKSIVQAHNGQIWAENAPEQGLIVTIQLPI
ncbi:MAG: HAMP domain-containing protein [Anaerolineales bacterium]|nr:HAMP domain-containing protein [Anaerolineales bacterium]